MRDRPGSPGAAFTDSQETKPMDATTTPSTQVATVKLLIGGKLVE